MEGRSEPTSGEQAEREKKNRTREGGKEGGRSEKRAGRVRYGRKERRTEVYRAGSAVMENGVCMCVSQLCGQLR